MRNCPKSRDVRLLPKNGLWFVRLSIPASAQSEGFGQFYLLGRESQGRHNRPTPDIDPGASIKENAFATPGLFAFQEGIRPGFDRTRRDSGCPIEPSQPS